MDLLLTIFKFAGIVVGGVSGVLGTITKTHDEKTITPLIYGGEPKVESKLSRWGKISLSLTIVGALVAAGAQVAESWKKQQEDNDSRRRTEQQIQQANEMLKRLEEQGRQSGTILNNVELQNTLAKQSLDTLSIQSDQTKTILTNVQQQGVIAEQSLDSLTTQADQTRAVVSELRRQGTLAHQQLEQTKEQIQLSRQSLGEIYRIITPIESFEIIATYEVTPIDTLAAELAPAILRLAERDLTNAQKGMPVDFWNDPSASAHRYADAQRHF
jgi:hypothetical protein